MTTSSAELSDVCGNELGGTDTALLPVAARAVPEHNQFK